MRGIKILFQCGKAISNGLLLMIGKIGEELAREAAIKMSVLAAGLLLVGICLTALVIKLFNRRKDK